MIDTSKYGSLPKDIEAMLVLVGAEPTVQAVWDLMDTVWESCGASFEDPESLARFYSHPVWVFNGMFIEHDAESMQNRQEFVKCIDELFAKAKVTPTRIADYGGGFGTFARMLAAQFPQCQVEIIEPFPSEVAQRLSAEYSNIAFQPALNGRYDMVVALDVLEHVENPLHVVHAIAEHLNVGGYFFAANCFFPVIKCHDPRTFYLRKFFKYMMSKMGFASVADVLYAQCFQKKGTLIHPDQQPMVLHAALCKQLFLAYSIARNMRNELREAFGRHGHAAR